MKCWVTLDWHSNKPWDRTLLLHFEYPRFERTNSNERIWDESDSSLELMYVDGPFEDSIPVDLFNLLQSSDRFDDFLEGKDPIELDLSLSQITSCVKSIQSSVLDINLKSLI